MSISYAKQRNFIRTATLVLQGGVGLWTYNRTYRMQKAKTNTAMRTLGLYAAANIGALALEAISAVAVRVVDRKESKELRDYQNKCDTLICSLSDVERELSYSGTPLTEKQVALFNWCRGTIDELRRHRDSITNTGRVENIYRAVVERGISLYSPA